MELRDAEKQKIKLRIGLSAPSGAGKTLSALLIAGGIASDWSKVALIDSENGRGDLYDSFKKGNVKIGKFKVLRLKAPFSPERYIEAIKACEAAKMEVIIIDSITHEWEGKGGCLEINDRTAATKFRGNTWSAWSETTPRHQAFIDTIIQSDCHILTTVRNKTATAMEGKKIAKVGIKEITREGFEYELTVNFNIDRETHIATVAKDNTNLFEGKDGFIITKKTGKALFDWANDGTEPPTLISEEETKSLNENWGKFWNLKIELFPEEKNNEGKLKHTKTLSDPTKLATLNAMFKKKDVSTLLQSEVLEFLVKISEEIKKLEKIKATNAKENEAKAKAKKA